MKLNISYPVTGQQKCIEIDDDNVLMPFFDKSMFVFDNRCLIVFL